eukprot:m51a1_g11382 putative xylanase (249) ;mRNA; r:3489-4466
MRAKPLVAAAVASAALALTLWLSAAPAEPSAPPPPPRTYRIVCAGDSITEGFPPRQTSDWTYPRLLEALVNASGRASAVVLNSGVRRARCLSLARSGATLGASWRLPWRNTLRATEAFASRPDVVVVMLGTNDAYAGYSEQAFREAYATLVAELRALVPSPQVLLCVPPPLYRRQGERATVINERFPVVVPQIAKASGAGVVDVFNALGGRDLGRQQLFSDGLHPNEEGNKVIAQTVFEALRVPLHLA